MRPVPRFGGTRSDDFMESRTAASSGSSMVVHWILGLVAATILYLLSGPPVFILAMRGFLPPKGVEIARRYTRPFVWARDKSPLSGLLTDYTTWWWTIAGPP